MVDINAKLDEIFSPRGKKIFIGLVCLGIINIIVLLMVSLFIPKQQNKEVMVNSSEYQEEMRDIKDLEGDLGAIEQPEDKMVALNNENIGRDDPFVPSYGAYGDGVDLVTPPTTIPTEDTSALLTTKVSGIMYDTKSPSAILNIDGTDYFVKSGDYISGYKILSVNKDFVTIKSGANIYRAKVGQLVSGGVAMENMYNLNNRFGGNRR